MTDPTIPPAVTGWVKQILTGRDNRTAAIGRFFSLILLALVILVLPTELLTVAYKKLEIGQWAAMLAQWQVFVPVLSGTAAGLIAGTAFTEPKPPKDSDNG